MVILWLGGKRMAVHGCVYTTSDQLHLLGFKNIPMAPQCMLMELNNRLVFLAVTQMVIFSEMTPI